MWYTCTFRFAVLSVCTIVDCTAGMQICRCRKQHAARIVEYAIYYDGTSWQFVCKIAALRRSWIPSWPRFVQLRLQHERLRKITGRSAWPIPSLRACAPCGRARRACAPPLPAASPAASARRPCTASVAVPPYAPLWRVFQPKTSHATADLKLMVVDPTTDTLPTHTGSRRTHRCITAWWHAP